MVLKKSNKKIHVEDDRTGLDGETLKRAFIDNLFYAQGKTPETATPNDLYMSLAYTVRDRIMHRWLHSRKISLDSNARRVGYLSAEFLMGPHLGNNLLNLGLFQDVKKALAELGLNLENIIQQEQEPGLGNGGLGRLAACFLDSLATLNIPAVGYGIRYEFGIFDQEIKNGWQVEITDKWLKYGNPWEIARNESAVEVKFKGYTQSQTDEMGNYRSFWYPGQTVLAIPYDTPIVGYKTNNAAVLRLWKAEATESFNFQTFNEGDFFGAVEDKILSENITKVLYPNDESASGKELRLMQQYFFVSATLQDALSFHLDERKLPIDDFYKKITLQLNDTHPAIAIVELMRLLLDVYLLDWDKSWHITTHTFAFTNHTLLPEALEKWALPMFRNLLPRHIEIIMEINHHFIAEVRHCYPGDEDKVARMSIIDESDQKYVRMANLAVVGSYAVNGVAALHTHLLTSHVMKDFYDMWPTKFSNKTNGVTPRRWIALANPNLCKLIESKIGDKWLHDLSRLKKLEKYADDSHFRDEWRQAHHSAKERLTQMIQQQLNISIDPHSLFDVQVKRIHEYKRQHLNVLHIISLYFQLKENPNLDIVPRTFIFGGKAAPGYFMAKLIIKLIHAVADVVNNDPQIKGKLKVVFLRNYNVKNSQLVYPAADLSEQISTAGKEASGTGNMKFTMNGALTIGTLDGANIEIREDVGEENFFLFGLKADEVNQFKSEGYNPYSLYDNNPELKNCIDKIESGFFSPDHKELFHPITHHLKYDDFYMLCADFQSYVACQKQVSQAFRDKEKWTKMSILNTARSGKFSSDRTIKQYCDDIWKIKPIQVKLPTYTTKAHKKIKFNQ